jgi:DnaK suppressor protein
MAKNKSPFSTDFLKKTETALLAEKTKLEKELVKFSKKKSDQDDYDAAFPDYGDKEDENAAEVADYVVNLSLEENLKKALRDTNQSLERLKKGEYGICKYCHKPIEEKRLMARLTSSSCMSCKKTITQEV